MLAFRNFNFQAVSTLNPLESLDPSHEFRDFVADPRGNLTERNLVVNMSGCYFATRFSDEPQNNRL